MPAAMKLKFTNDRRISGASNSTAACVAFAHFRFTRFSGRVRAANFIPRNKNLRTLPHSAPAGLALPPPLPPRPCALREYRSAAFREHFINLEGAH